MNHTVSHERALVDWGVATRPIAGEAVSGDLHLVQPFNHGVLLAAIDGLGHGKEAVAAARAAVAVLKKHPREPVVQLIQRCHEALMETRGAVMTVASLHASNGPMTWLGVGNVECRLLHANPHADRPSDSVLLRGGVVGYQLPVLRPRAIAVAPGDLLVFATDGIRADFADGLSLGQTPKQIAIHIMNQHFKGTDDALVLVARFLGMP
jgi:hypothetical protein